MIWKLLLPKEGGGAIRRFLGIRNRLYKDAWNDDRPLRGPISLFDFRQKDDAQDLRYALHAKKLGFYPTWRVSDDSVIGGFSKSRIAFHEGQESYPEDANNADKQVPFLRWSGHIDTQINRQSPLARDITRSGFAAILSPEYPFGAPLGNKYKALEICCRTDGRTYAVNLRVETYFPGDIYQGFIGKEGVAHSQQQSSPFEGVHRAGVIDEAALNEPQNEPSTQTNQSLDVRKFIKGLQKHAYAQDPSNDSFSGYPPYGFQRLILPFQSFSLTSYGRVRPEQRYLDGSIKIESIGFTLMDGKNGDFTFDLVSIRAVNILEGEIVGPKDVEAREEMLKKQFQEGVYIGSEKNSSDDVVENKQSEKYTDMK